jgi:hypothetical protein
MEAYEAYKRYVIYATKFESSVALALFFDPEDGGDIFLRNIG